VASSWRNDLQPEVVHALRSDGHAVYDFRNPGPGHTGFHWSDIDRQWQTWSPSQFRDGLDHRLAIVGFDNDMDALSRADVVVLVLPCGRSAHLEFGFARGKGAKGVILLTDGEPELMYRMADRLVLDIEELCRAIAELE
jgi:hypothetical protein